MAPLRQYHDEDAEDELGPVVGEVEDVLQVGQRAEPLPVQGAEGGGNGKRRVGGMCRATGRKEKGGRRAARAALRGRVEAEAVRDSEGPPSLHGRSTLQTQGMPLSSAQLRWGHRGSTFRMQGSEGPPSLHGRSTL